MTYAPPLSSAVLAGPKPGRRGDVLLAGAVGVAVVFRTWRYLARPSIWGDEAFLLLNVQTYSLHRLLTGRLDAFEVIYHNDKATQAGAPLFLAWLKWTTTFPLSSELGVRLVPFVAALLSVVFFALLARRYLPAFAPLAVLAFGSTRELIFQAANCKPYSVDVMGALAVAWVALVPKVPDAVRPLLVAAVGVGMMSLSYSAVVYTPVALLAALLAHTGGRFGLPRSGRVLAAYAAALVVTGAATLALKRLCVDVQSDPFLARYWDEGFGDLRRPWTIPLWLAESTWELFNYAGAGFGVAIAVIGAGLVVCRGKEGGVDRAFLAMTLGPTLFVMAAGTLNLYPFLAKRLCLFLVPLLILAGFYMAERLYRTVRDRRLRLLPAGALAASCAVTLAMAVHFLVTGRPTNGGVREALEHAVATNTATPPAQIATPVAGTSLIARLYGLDAAHAIVPYDRLGTLCPDLPLRIVFSRRGEGGKNAQESNAIPAIQGRTFLREETLEGAVVRHYSEVRE